MLLVMPHATRSLRPNMTAGMPTYATPATWKPSPQSWTSYQHDTASNAMCGSLATIGRPERQCRPATTQLLLPVPSGSAVAWPTAPCGQGEASRRRWSVRFGRDHRLLVRLAEQEFAIERPVSEDPPGQFGHDDHREPAGEVPAELALDGQAVDRRPRLGAVAEQVELDRQPIAAVRDPGVDARRERVQERSGLARQPLEFVAGDPVQPNRSRDDVRRQTVRPEHFGQSSHPLAPEVVHLEQPVLRHRVAEAEPEVVLPIREDVRYAPTIPLDDHTGPYGSGHFTLTTWYPACGLAPPPGVELGTRPSHRSTDRIDRLAGPQPPQDVLWGYVHQ